MHLANAAMVICKFVQMSAIWRNFMAGIGFELKKIYGRKTLVANLWGTIYATMTTIGPAVLSAVLMLVLKITLDRSGLTILESRFFISTTTYAFLIATLVSVLFSAPVSRYISDCIYLEKEGDICPSAFGVLALSSFVSGIIMLVLCVGMYLANEEISLTFLVAYYFLGVLVTDAYSMMTYASAMKHYKELTFSFFLGGVLAFGVYFFCSSVLEIHKVVAACIALACCYFMIVFALIFQCVKAFGVPCGRCFGFLSYFIKYPKLAIGGVAYTLGLYVPTVIYWIFSEMAEQVSIFRTFPAYDMGLFLAVVMNMPSLVIFVVKVETSFYEKYTLYVSALNHGTYDMIEKERGNMARTLRHQLFFVYEIQLIITVVLVCLTCVFFPYLNASFHMLNMFIVLSLGMYTVFCMYFTIVVFYYFSDYTGACIGSLVFLAVNVLSASAAAWANAFYPMPLLLGGLSGWVVSFLLLRHRMETLDKFLMC